MLYVDMVREFDDLPLCSSELEITDDDNDRYSLAALRHAHVP
jgi:hypothetical protein